MLKNFKQIARERFLTEIELARLGDAIRQAETNGIPWREPDRSNPKSKHAPKLPESRLTVVGPHAAAALRLLIFTGARLREILDLEWDHVDLQRGLLFLPDSKIGKKTIVLGNAAIALLANLDRVGKYVNATTRSRFRPSWDTRGLQIRILLARNWARLVWRRYAVPAH